MTAVRFQDLLVELDAQDAAERRIEATAGELAFLPDGRLAIRSAGVELAPSGPVIEKIANERGIPSSWFKDDVSPGIRAVLTEKIPARDASARVAVIAVASEARRIEDAEVLNPTRGRLLRVVGEAIAEETSSLLVVDRHERPDGAFAISVVLDTARDEVKPGDVVRHGVTLALPASETRDGIQVTSFIERLVCRNGLVARVCAGDRSQQLKRRRVDAGDDRARLEARFLGELRELTARAWVANGTVVDGLRRSTQTSVADPRAVIARLAPNRAVQRELDGQLVREHGGRGPVSLFDLIQVFTWFSSHRSEFFDWDVRRRIALLAGELTIGSFHSCPACKRRLSSRQAAPNDVASA